MDAPTALGFAARLREATASAHSSAEGSTFLDDLLSGRLEVAAHAAMLAQLHGVYAELEAAGAALRADAVARPFLDDALLRLPALEADLSHLLGPAWRRSLEPTPAAARYAARVREVARWPGGFVAHHYLRYLGDLSGGQVVRTLLARTHGLGEAGLAFYTFPVRPKPYRERYRALLDAAPWDAAEQARITAEVERGYRLNRDLLADLGALSPRWRRPA